MKYTEQGKRSRAWWLQAIKWFGETGRNGIAKEAKIGANYVTDAIADLKDEGYIVQEGESGKGNRPKYRLTELGEGYLTRNQDELQDVPEPKPANPPVFTWKRVLGGQVRYFMDGQMVSSALVPDAEIQRMVQEIRAGEPKAEDEPAPIEQTRPDTDVYTWQKPITGPVRYFCNGKFVLQTQIPMGELRRMQREQDPEPATPPVSHPVPTVPEFKGPPLPKAIAKEPLREEHDDVAVDMTEDAAVDGLMAAREAFNYKPDPSPRINKEQGSEKPESDKNDSEPSAEAKARTAKGIAIAQHVANNGGVPVDDEQHLPAAEPVTPPQIILRHGKKTPAASLNTSSEPSFKDAFREVLVEILLEKFASQVTAADVMERLERRDV